MQVVRLIGRLLKSRKFEVQPKVSKECLPNIPLIVVIQVNIAVLETVFKCLDVIWHHFQSFGLHNCQVINTFLSLKIKEVEKPEDRLKRKKEARQERFLKSSRNDRKVSRTSKVKSLLYSSHVLLNFILLSLRI